MFYVYILKSQKSGDFYKGMTQDLKTRLKQHFSGRCASTKKMLPLELVHVEIYQNRLQARKMEKYLKSGYGREIIKELFS